MYFILQGIWKYYFLLNSLLPNCPSDQTFAENMWSNTCSLYSEDPEEFVKYFSKYSTKSSVSGDVVPISATISKL